MHFLDLSSVSRRLRIKAGNSTSHQIFVWFQKPQYSLDMAYLG